MAVRIENLRLGDEAEVMALFVHYGKVPCLRVVEGAHHLLHAVRVVQAGGEGGHQFAHGEPMVQFLAEHDVAYVVQYDNAEQYAGLVSYGEDVASGGGDGFHQFAQVHFGADGDEVFFYDVLHFHERQYRFVLVVGDEFALLGQTHGVDAVGFEDDDGQVGADCYDH